MGRFQRPTTLDTKDMKFKFCFGNGFVLVSFTCNCNFGFTGEQLILALGIMDHVKKVSPKYESKFAIFQDDSLVRVKIKSK